MTNKELQDALNGRLEKFGGEKYTGKEACTPVYHRWYMHEIESELESRGIEIFRAATWKIVAEIDGPGDLRVGYEPVASVNVESKEISGINSAAPAWLSRSEYSSARICRA